MTTLTGTLTPLFDTTVVGRMRRQLGVDEQTTRQGTQVALPLPLDTNRDGSAVDDVIGLAGKFFGRRA
jgi:hypothetical protein